ncbi:hypothetical protein [Bosea sp. AAP35]|uniref:hypothetical protein n=1 Tax=Bosea sp. AAP35 TaxID=1523417 RepID=UPI0012E0F028|nr:hypothetical protein [Bosea sp. AAP35]
MVMPVMLLRECHEDHESCVPGFCAQPNNSAQPKPETGDSSYINHPFGPCVEAGKANNRQYWAFSTKRPVKAALARRNCGVEGGIAAANGSVHVRVQRSKSASKKRHTGWIS